MRFSLLDQITSLESGQSIVATKSLSLAEEYLADHFPGFPVDSLLVEGAKGRLVHGDRSATER